MKKSVKTENIKISNTDIPGSSANLRLNNLSVRAKQILDVESLSIWLWIKKPFFGLELQVQETGTSNHGTNFRLTSSRG